MNYLQIAFGSGSTTIYDIDIIAVEDPDAFPYTDIPGAVQGTIYVPMDVTVEGPTNYASSLYKIPIRSIGAMYLMGGSFDSKREIPDSGNTNDESRFQGMKISLFPEGMAIDMGRGRMLPSLRVWKVGSQAGEPIHEIIIAPAVNFQTTSTIDSDEIEGHLPVVFTSDGNNYTGWDFGFGYAHAQTMGPSDYTKTPSITSDNSITSKNTFASYTLYITYDPTVHQISLTEFGKNPISSISWVANYLSSKAGLDAVSAALSTTVAYVKGRYSVR